MVMIKNFIHKGLERFYRTSNKSGIQAKHASRLRLILSNLDQAENSEDMDLKRKYDGYLRAEPINFIITILNLVFVYLTSVFLSKVLKKDN